MGHLRELWTVNGKKKKRSRKDPQLSVTRNQKTISADSSNFDQNFRNNFKTKLPFPGSDKRGVSLSLKHDFHRKIWKVLRKSLVF